MRPTDLHIGEVSGKGARKKVDHIIERNHYLQSVPNVPAKHRYIITKPLQAVVGAAVWGKPIARHEDQDNTCELMRFWTSDCLPKNSESYSLGYMMRDMEKKDYERLIAYASSGQGHEGTIYKATNWDKVKEGEDYKSGWENRKGREDRDKSGKIKYQSLIE